MTAYELHDLLVDHRGLIANTWQFFVSVHLALLGLAFVVRFQERKLILRTLMFVGYAGFMFINYNAQLDNYRYAAVLLDYLAVATQGAEPAQQALHQVFRKGWVLDYLAYIYGVSMLLGLLAIYLPAVTVHKGVQQDASVLVM
jgi:hypothetical protein